MATYAIGDIQGCFAEFENLLDRLNFDAGMDQLWLVGDLVNRGPASLQVLRCVKSLGDSAVVVLGNHDLHLLALYFAGHKPRPSDTLVDILQAADVAELMQWLVSCPLLHWDRQLKACMSHAGVPHIWSINQAHCYAEELQGFIRTHTAEYFQDMYGNEPNPWSEQLSGMQRARCITNYLARMRFIDRNGCLDFSSKGPPGTQSEGFLPWCELHTDEAVQIYFGHWAALKGQKFHAHIHALDTGCVWGASLTAQCIETGEITTVQAINPTE